MEFIFYAQHTITMKLIALNFLKTGFEKINKLKNQSEGTSIFIKKKVENIRSFPIFQQIEQFKFESSWFWREKIFFQLQFAPIQSCEDAIGFPFDERIQFCAGSLTKDGSNFYDNSLFNYSRPH